MRGNNRRRKTNDATKITTALELPPVTTAKEQLLQPLTNTSRWILDVHVCGITCIYTEL